MTTTVCVEAIGATNNSGYVSTRLGGKRIGAHRAAYIKAFGEIPLGQYVLHKCDNRKCINTEHLFLGTQAENIQDMVAKGRQATEELLPQWKGGVWKDREQRLAKMKAYYALNRERIQAQQKEYRLTYKRKKKEIT